LEHGFADRSEGEIHITFEGPGDQVFIWVANNGQPLPDGFDITGSAHLGLQIVTNLAGALGGSFKLSDSLGWALAEVQFTRATSE
jgi:two-component sensor histidine kinase